MSSNAWNIEDVELEDAPIFEALAAEYGDYVLAGPKDGCDD